MKNKGRKLLVATVGLATVSYVIACGSTTETSGNLMPPDTGGADVTSGNLVPPDTSIADTGIADTSTPDTSTADTSSSDTSSSDANKKFDAGTDTAPPFDVSSGNLVPPDTGSSE